MSIKFLVLKSTSIIIFQHLSTQIHIHYSVLVLSTQTYNHYYLSTSEYSNPHPLLRSSSEYLNPQLLFLFRYIARELIARGWQLMVVEAMFFLDSCLSTSEYSNTQPLLSCNIGVLKPPTIISLSIHSKRTDSKRLEWVIGC